MYVPKNSMLQLGSKERASGANRPGMRPGGPGARKGGRNRAAILAVSLLLVVLAAAAVLQAQGEGKAGRPAALLHDLERLWTWCGQVMEGGSEQAEWTIRWDWTSPGHAGEAMDEAAGLLLRDAKGGPLDKLVTNDGKSASSEWPGGAAVLSVHAAEEYSTGTGMFALLTIKANSGTTLKEAEETAKLVSSRIRETAPSFKAGIKARGYAEPSAAAQLERLSLGRVLERYDENGTVSVTLASDLLQSSQSLDSTRTANLQIASHLHTEREGQAELTVGVPLLSGDFAATTSSD